MPLISHPRVTGWSMFVLCGDPGDSESCERDLAAPGESLSLRNGLRARKHLTTWQSCLAKRKTVTAKNKSHASSRQQGAFRTEDGLTRLPKGNRSWRYCIRIGIEKELRASVAPCFP